MSTELENMDMDLDLKESRIYEVGYHLAPILSEETVPTEVAEIVAIIQKNKGILVSEEMPKLIPLAYDLTKVIAGHKHKFEKAYFGWIKFEADPPAIVAIQQELMPKENIVRFLIVKTVKESTLMEAMPKNGSQKSETEKPAVETGTDEKKDKAPVSEAELDKTIDKLLVE